MRESAVKMDNKVNKTFFIRTFGCQMNVADAGEYAQHLQNFGLLPTEDLNDAKVVLLNTCTVRQHAEDRALSFLGQLKKLKMKNEKLKIIVAGCVAQRLGEDLKRRFLHIDLVIGAKDIDLFPQILTERLKDFQEPEGSTPYRSTNLSTYQPMNLSTDVTAFVTIMRGCENFCSYCIVPYVRGKEKSRPVEEIISEINCLIKQGVKEVTLLGQNVNSYKLQITNYKLQIGFADLLTEVNKIERLERIRFVTSHPKDLSEKIIFAIRDLDKVCEHLHLPVQAGSNRILEKMNRKYTREGYLSLVAKIKDTIPEIAITTDIIVGFPGETEEDFQDTLDLVREVEFDSAYTFKYSPRPGTAGAKLDDDVPLEVKEERLKILNQTCNEISQKKNQKLIGTKQEVLIEKNVKQAGKLEGRTRTNKIVFIQSRKNLVGKKVEVKIIEAYPHSLFGKIKQKGEKNENTT